MLDPALEYFQRSLECHSLAAKNGQVRAAASFQCFLGDDVKQLLMSEVYELATTETQFALFLD